MAYNSNDDYIRVKLPDNNIYKLYIPTTTQAISNGLRLRPNTTGNKNILDAYISRDSVVSIMAETRAINHGNNNEPFYNCRPTNSMTCPQGYDNNLYALPIFRQIKTNFNAIFDYIYIYYGKDNYTTSYNTLSFPIIDKDGNEASDKIYFRYRWTNDRLYSETIYDQSYQHDEPINYPANTLSRDYQFTIGISFNGSNYIETPLGYKYFICRNKGTNDLYYVSVIYNEGGSGSSWGVVPSSTVVDYFSFATTFMLRESTSWKIDISDIYFYKIADNYFSNKNTILNNILVSTPYSNNGTDIFNPTQGDYDATTESVTVPSVRTDNVVTSNLLKLYDLSTANLDELHNVLYTQDFIDNLIKAVENPIQTIVGLFNLPFKPSNEYAGNIYLGNYDTEISSMRVGNRYEVIDCGSLAIGSYYGLGKDYNTTIQLFLPYVNTINLNIDDVLESVLNVKYYVDIISGDFIVFVTATKNNAKGYNYTNVIFTGGGNCSSQIPITSGGIDAMGIASGLLGVALNPNPMGMLGATATALTSQYSYSGSCGGNQGYLGIQKPFVKITIPNVMLPSNYDNLHGYLSKFYCNFSDLNGYATPEDFKVDFGTTEEQTIITNMLKSGVWFKSGSNTPTTLTNGIYLLDTSDNDYTVGKTFTTIGTITGTNKSSVDVLNRSITIETNINIDSVNYLYDSDLGRFYFIRNYEIIKSGLYVLNLECDLLQTYKSNILAMGGIVGRSSNIYNAMLNDNDLPTQENNIVRILNFPNGFSGDSTILVAI